MPISSRNAIKKITGRPLENSRGRPVEFTGRPVKSTGRPLEFSRGRPLEQKIWPNIIKTPNNVSERPKTPAGKNYWECKIKMGNKGIIEVEVILR